MRLVEAIIDANHRALAGDPNAGLHPADFESELPLVALTCVDPRLNAMFPSVLGVPPEQFIWLRNAGNVLTGPVSSTMRSLALACAIKGGKEIAIIGHTDCQVAKTTIMQLLDRFRALGIERHMLPDNLTEYFGMFGSDRQNVIKATGIVRSSPLIGPKIPVHGLLVDTATGNLEWLVNGYENLGTTATRWNEVVKSAGQTVDALKSLTDFSIGDMKFPETKIGEIVSHAEGWLGEQVKKLGAESSPVPAPPPNASLDSFRRGLNVLPATPARPAVSPAPPPLAPPLPRKAPLPPVIRPRISLRKGPK